MIIGKPQGRKGYGCWLNFTVTRKLQNHKKQPGCRNPAPVHALIPFYSTHRTLCPNHPIIARSTASVGKPCPCACTNTVPLGKKIAICIGRETSKFRCGRNLGNRKTSETCWSIYAPMQSAIFFATGTVLAHAQGQGFPTECFELAIIGWFGQKRMLIWIERNQYMQRRKVFRLRASDPE